MPDGRQPAEWTEAARQARELAALIDAAGDDLERNGPELPTNLHRRLEALEAEWAGEGQTSRRAARPTRRRAELNGGARPVRRVAR